MTIKELDAAAVRNWLRIDDDSADEIPVLMSTALDFICKYTGRTQDFVNAAPALVYPYLAIVGEMYERRQYQTEKGSVVNETMRAILESYTVNNIPGETDLVGDA